MSQLIHLNGQQLDREKLARFEKGFLKLHTTQINTDLKAYGAVKYDLLLPETLALPYIINANERILGIVYGRYKQEDDKLIGRGALVATNHRVLLVDKKPLFVRCDELTYRVVSGVSYGRVGPIGHITLHTRMGDTKLRTFNQKCAKSFVDAVEANIFEDKEQ